jgi:magnesium transporter
MNQEVRHKVVNDGDMFSGSSSEYLPFEFRALEVALEAACTFLDAQVCMSLKRATSLNENKC